ncbi:MAG: hypothetical protein AAGN15_04655 [Cyanobacteria bacterium J06581_3]
MKDQDGSDIFIPPNRLICLIVFLFAFPLFWLSFGAYAQPDAPTTPYINSLALIWIVALFSTLWLAIMTPAIVKRGAPKRASKISMAVYRCLIGFSAVILLGQFINQLLST